MSSVDMRETGNNWRPYGRPMGLQRILKAVESADMHK
jgi:hypothetical protein